MLSINNQVFDIFYMLGFFNNYYLIVRHHRKFSRCSNNCLNSCVFSVKNYLIKTLFFFWEYIVMNIVSNFIYKIWFVSHKKIYRLVYFLFQVRKYLFILIFEFHLYLFFIEKLLLPVFAFN
jgi:hypothetical protein